MQKKKPTAIPVPSQNKKSAGNRMLQMYKNKKKDQKPSEQAKQVIKENQDSNSNQNLVLTSKKKVEVQKFQQLQSQYYHTLSKEQKSIKTNKVRYSCFWMKDRKKFINNFKIQTYV